MDFWDYFQGVFQGPEKTSSRHWRKWNWLNAVQSLPFFIYFASAKCLALFWMVAFSCLFAGPREERALHILRAPSQGLYCQTTQTMLAGAHLRKTPECTMMSWQQGDLPTVMGEWRALGRGQLGRSGAGNTNQPLHLMHWESSSCVHLTKLCGGSNRTRSAKVCGKTTQNTI